MAQFDFAYGDYAKTQKQINSVYDKQKATQLAEYSHARNKATSQLKQQKNEIMPTFQSKRNQADVVNKQSVQALREAMASQGLLGSGENVSANVGLMSSRQNSLNDINLEQQQTENDFSRRLSDVNDPADRNKIISSIEALRSGALAEAYNRQQQLAYQKRMDDLAEQWRKKEWEYRLKQDREAAARARAARSGGGGRGRSGGGGGSYSAQSANPGLAKPLSESDLHWAVQQQIDKMNKVANPKTAAVAPHLGSTAYFNKMKRLMG
ncbi:hypothetical protein [Fictibacillus phosphorivorans]|uniref:hypothetical protein n=1 Tax=Fictibacillus phosphorivorans TaxID=1221500 RepID=UPI0035E67F86